MAVVEHAVLHVRPGQAAAFESALQQAIPLIAASPGFIDINVHPGVDAPGTYLLLVRWTDVAAHRDGFRTSDRYNGWRELLHRFYDPVPAVDYFSATSVNSAANEGADV